MRAFKLMMSKRGRAYPIRVKGEWIEVEGDMTLASEDPDAIRDLERWEGVLLKEVEPPMAGVSEPESTPEPTPEPTPELPDIFADMEAEGLDDLEDPEEVEEALPAWEDVEEMGFQDARDWLKSQFGINGRSWDELKEDYERILK